MKSTVSATILISLIFSPDFFSLSSIASRIGGLCMELQGMPTTEAPRFSNFIMISKIASAGFVFVFPSRNAVLSGIFAGNERRAIGKCCWSCCAIVWSKIFFTRSSPA